MRRGTPSLAMALVALVYVQAQAEDVVVEGAARVIDGDTLEVGSTVVRLADIDAPELGQRCSGPRALERCGKVAADALSDRVDGEWVTCAVQTTDVYGRSIASCSFAGIDLSTWLVAEGYALAFVAYSDRLQGVEAEARAKGCWAFCHRVDTALGVSGGSLAGGRAERTGGLSHQGQYQPEQRCPHLPCPLVALLRANPDRHRKR